MEIQKPLKYFDVYTQQPSEDATSGMSRSTSNLQIVVKGSRQSSHQGRRPKIKDKQQHRPETVERASEAIDYTSRTLLTAASLAQHTAMIPPEQSPPLQHSRRPPYIKVTAEDVSPSVEVLDIFAGPSSPVAASSVANLSVLPTCPSTPSTAAIASDHVNDLPSSPRLSRSSSNSDCTPYRESRPSQPARSNTDTSFPTSPSISEITARCFGRDVKLPPIVGKSCTDVSIPSIDDIIRNHHVEPSSHRSLAFTSEPPVPSIPEKYRPKNPRILSIDEIVGRNKLANPIFRLASHSAPPNSFAEHNSRPRTESKDSEASHARSSLDSVRDEILQSIKQDSQRCKNLHPSRSQPSLSSTTHLKMHIYGQQAECKDSTSDMSSSKSPTLYQMDTSNRFSPSTHEDITRYLRSARLTRLFSMRKPPNHHLVVSLADVGCEDGHPVVVFLGLGSVRYLVALYDELAASLGLRLICIDRWGLGKTGEVPDSRRGFHEWATVVEEALDQLGVTRFSILAHSAGAPYALAASLRLEARVHGTIQLLAPWVGTTSDSSDSGTYKWLKFVPSGVIKTAQAAEWKLQGWKLGKLPKLQPEGLGFNPRAPIGSETAATSPVFTTFESEKCEKSVDSTDHSPVSPSWVRHYASANTFSEQESDASSQASPKQYSRLHPSRSPGSISSSTLPEPALAASWLSKRRESFTKSEDMTEVETKSRKPKIDLGTALMQASHSESLKGGTSDLLTLLRKNNKSSTFFYAEVSHPVRVWHGLKDDKINLQSVLRLESAMQKCTVDVVPGADHSLMTNVPVFVQVLQAIAAQW